MTAIERVIAYGALAVLLIIGVPWYFEHRGAKECVQAQTAVVEKAEVHNTQLETTQTADDAKAKGKLDEALTSPIGALPAIPASVHEACPSTVSSPRTHPSGSPPSAVLRVPETPSVVQPDWHALELGDVQSAHNADAQVTYLQGLLEAQYRLCSGK